MGELGGLDAAIAHAHDRTLAMRLLDGSERIEQRFSQMLQQGFLEEVRALRARPRLAPEAPSLRAVGYRQLWAHLTGEIDLPTATQRAVAATRQLAKRQLTWIHADPDWESLDPQQEGSIEAKVAALQRGLLSQR